MKLKFCLLIALVVSACQKQELPKSIAEPKKNTPSNIVSLEPERLAKLELGLYEVALKPFRYEVKIPADVFAHPNKESSVGTNISGRVQRLLVNENDLVREGEPIAVLESATIANLVAELRESMAAFLLAEADYKRKQKIASENILSEKVMLESQAALRVAEAQRFAAESRCLGAGFTKGDLEKIKASPDSAVARVLIRANLSGIVAKRFVTLGEYVEPNKPLFQLVNLDEVMLIGNVFEPEFGKVRVGQFVEVKLGAFHSETFVGKIHSIGAVVNETTHALPVRVTLANPKHILKPSMHAEMSISIELKTPELVVPTSAIGIDGERKILFVQKSDTLFEVREVKVAQETSVFSLIRDGVREGERVATQNIFFLKSQWKARELVED